MDNHGLAMDSMDGVMWFSGLSPEVRIAHGAPQWRVARPNAYGKRTCGNPSLI